MHFLGAHVDLALDRRTASGDTASLSNLQPCVSLNTRRVAIETAETQIRKVTPEACILYAVLDALGDQTSQLDRPYNMREGYLQVFFDATTSANDLARVSP